MDFDAYTFEDEHDESMELAPLAQLPLFFEPSREVRPEYNIGKFAGLIFGSPYSKDLKEVASHTWSTKYRDQEVKASLTISPLVSSKRPTTTTLRVYLALIQLWENQGRNPDGRVKFSARQLAEVIGWKWAGKATANRIRDHIKILHGTSMEWAFSFERSSGDVDRLVSELHILEGSQYFERTRLLSGEHFQAMQSVRFSADLIANMLANKVRPLNYHALRAISNDAAVNLYTKLDLFLAKRRFYQRNATDLLTELGLTGARYHKRFIRHQKLKELVKELDAVDLLNGRLRLKIAERADGTDWKLVAWKEPRKAPPKRSFKRYQSDEIAELLADDVIAELKRAGNAGNPRRGYILHLCRHLPEGVIRRACSNAKADYQSIKKSRAHIFVHEAKAAAKQAGVAFPEGARAANKPTAQGDFLNG